MIKQLLKRFLKKNALCTYLILHVIYIYLSFVYRTSTWRYIISKDYENIQQFLNEQGVMIALWHNRLAIAPGLFKSYKSFKALISPHSDGRIISGVVNKFNNDVIEGSTRKKSFNAVREIIKTLKSGNNIVITPDGPKGPVYQINSNITKIAKKYNVKLIPMSCRTNKYIVINSWDKLILPLPFGEITVSIGEQLQLINNKVNNDLLLQNKLNELSHSHNDYISI